MKTKKLVTRVLDTSWLSEQAGRPVRAARLRIKPRTSLVVGLDDPDGHPVSFAKDLLGACDPGADFAGPLATLGAEVTSTVLWG